MRYVIDHDYHIHSYLSSCSKDPDQSADRLLAYAKDLGLKRICVTDHYWDSLVPGASGWYSPQNFDHIKKMRPLPKANGIDFLFGCETDMDRYRTIGIPEIRFSDFDFIIVPTTHLHMTEFTIDPEKKGSHEYLADAWVKRFEALLDSPLPFGKIGLAHPACKLIYRNSIADYLKTLDLISSDDMERLFAMASEAGLGIELNKSDMKFEPSYEDKVLRMFKIAKNQGCKFYLGSDAHHPKDFTDAKEIFERAIKKLGLTEADKFHIEEV